MRIHNLLEEIVIDKINEILKEYVMKEQPKNTELLMESKLDIACYVLNRMNPVYVVSGRGLAYIDADYLEKLQREADLVTLIHQGIERILTAKRQPSIHHTGSGSNLKGDFFNFPIIKGRIFNSLNFEPVYGIEVKLNYEGKIMKMIEPNWQNPYFIAQNTAGNFYFWPFPVKASKAGQHMDFELEIVIDHKNYEELRHYFNLDLKSDGEFIDYFRVNKVYSLSDLYLLPA